MKVWLILFFLLIFASSVSAVNINEIMYNPEQNDNYNEWIEIFNGGGDINLENFTLCGKTLFSGYIDIEENVHQDSGFLLEAGGYAIITDGGTGTEVYDNFNVSENALALHVDSASLCNGLSNTGKTITIGINESILDEVSYSNDAGEGYSLELINGSFVESCIPGGTPGSGNSCVSVPEENQTQNETGQENQTVLDCSSIDVVNLTYYPESIKFGYSSEVEIDFNASCYEFNTTKILVYGSSSRVVSYENGSKIKKYADCNEGILYENLKNKTYSWDIPFFGYPNCDDRYNSENYTLGLRVCSLDDDNDWDNYYETTFVVKFSGENSSACDEWVEETEEGSNETLTNPSKIGTQGEKETLISGGLRK